MVPTDKTGMMVNIMKEELEKFRKMKEKFVEEFSPEDYEYISQVGAVRLWQEKILKLQSALLFYCDIKVSLF